MGDWAEVYDEAPEVVAEGLNSLLDYCYRHFQTYDLYALWLTNLSGVAAHYCNEGKNSVREYALPDRYLVIDDLDEEGILFVTPTSIASLPYQETVVQRR